jgi:hypothetical protein
MLSRMKILLAELNAEGFFNVYNMNTEILDDIFISFLEPFLKKLNAHPKINQWSMWQPKALLVHFFNLMSGLLRRVASTAKELAERDDPINLPIEEK